MRRSSGQRSPLRQPVKLRRLLRRIFWDSQAMLTATTPRKSRKEPRQARLRSSCMQSGSVTLRWPKSGVPTLLCTPLALHGATLADLAAGHSLVAALRGAGIGRLFMTDWRSASADMRFLGIDEYLADLNVLVDHVGGLVDLIGLCQGGWLSLVYAGQFPAKVRKLVMAGAPVDIAARQSRLSAMAEATPLIMFQSLVNLGDGRVIGRNLAKFWGNDTDANGIRESLQTVQPIGSSEFTQLEAIFKNWNSWTIDLPGTYYLEVIEKLYRRNELASGSFVALGAKDRPLAPAASNVSSCWQRRRSGCSGTIACSGAAGRNAAGVSPPRGRAM